MLLTSGISPTETYERVGGWFAVELDVHMTIFPVLGVMHDWNNAAHISDGSAGFQVTHHVGEILGGVKSVFLQSLQCRDPFLIQTDAVVWLAHMDVETKRIEDGSKLRLQIAFCLSHHEVKNLRQGLILVVLPKFFNVRFNSLVQDDGWPGLQVNPTGFDLHLLIARDDTVVRTHCRRGGEIRGE